MNISSFLHNLRQDSIEFRLGPEDTLICDAPKIAMTEDVQNRIRQHKQEIINFLKQVPANSWSALVPIQPHGNKPPFFCFHGAGGNVLNYAALIEHLGYDQPIYGLQSVGLDGITPPFQRIEPMAAHYLEEIKTLQSQGPYFLGGGSLGGMIAFEAAQQLHKQGEKMGLLVMFDTLGPNQNITAGGRLVHRLRNTNLRNLITYTSERFSERQRNKKSLEMCIDYQKRGEAIPHDLRFWFIERMNYIAMANYEFSVYDGEITLLKGTDEDGGLWSDPLRGWQDMTTGELRVYEIHGHHDTLVEQPMLGVQLAKCLGNTHTAG